MFETCDRAWRGLGVIPTSGLRLREPYRLHDAEVRFPRADGVPASESEICIAGEVLRGRAKPNACPAFGDAVHARVAARRADGLGGGRVRRVLPRRPDPRGGAGVSEELGEFALRCPVPLPPGGKVLLGHGSGGKLSASLIRDVFVPVLGGSELARLGDAAVVEVNDLRLAFSTDSFVVTPKFFPGSNIGELAVNGTVNDLAMMGAWPLFLSAALILEEGLDLEVLGAVVAAMADACERAGVALVTGDTKVVEQGSADGLFVTTAGIGIVPTGSRSDPSAHGPAIACSSPAPSRRTVWR